jgi:CheY-like chemotaxis protein
MNEPFNLVIIDKFISQVDGVGLAEKIKTDQKLANLPVILVGSLTGQGHSEAEKKLRFSVTLKKPIKQSELYDAILNVISSDTNSEEKASSSKKAGTRLARASSPKREIRDQKRILVVEDNAVNQLLSVTLLKKLGYVTQAVANGFEAIDAVAQSSFDLILMDCQMPELDGFQATERIRSWEKESGRDPIVIVALTANAMKEDREKCLECGMNDYLAKPIKKDELSKILKKWLTHSLDEKTK